MFLREYLYVDVDKVRGILSQLENGVPETSKIIERTEKAAGLKNNFIGEFGGRSSDESSLEKSLGDALFPLLEEQLEALSVLSDISEDIITKAGLATAHERLTPGDVVRITAPARIFHPEQLSQAMAGIGTAATGLIDMQNGLGKSEPTLPTPGNQRKNAVNTRQRAKARPIPDSGYPEDILFDLPDKINGSIPRDFLIGIVRLIRGVFQDGVHLQFNPIDGDDSVITARLETGRRFLDSTPEVLFSRYGFRPQEWTIVGMVGHLAEPKPSAIDTSFLGKFNRSSMLQFAASLLQEAGESGFIDLPTGLGFSVVPLAVYRGIGWTTDSAPEADGPQTAIEPARLGG